MLARWPATQPPCPTRVRPSRRQTEKPRPRPLDRMQQLQRPCHRQVRLGCHQQVASRQQRGVLDHDDASAGLSRLLDVLRVVQERQVLGTGLLECTDGHHLALAIADHLGLTESTVRSYLSRALDQLARLLGDS